EVAAQLADRVDADHLAERFELVEVWVDLARGVEELTRERAREVALADALRTVEEVGVGGAFGQRGGEEALRLCLLAKALEGGHGHGRRSPQVEACRRGRRRARGTARAAGGSRRRR